MGEGRITMSLNKETTNTSNTRFPLKLNLQYFADGGDETTGTDEKGTEVNGEEVSSNELKTFDDLLKEKTYQSEFDKRIAKALETAKGKWTAEQDKAIQDAKTEAEKLATMNAEQKAKYEAEKKEADFNKRLAELNARELKATAKDTLASEGLPAELAEVLNYSDAETCNKSIEHVKKAFQTAIEKAVNEKLGDNNPPKRGNSTEDAETEKLRKIMGL